MGPATARRLRVAAVALEGINDDDDAMEVAREKLRAAWSRCCDEADMIVIDALVYLWKKQGRKDELIGGLKWLSHHLSIFSLPSFSARAAGGLTFRPSRSSKTSSIPSSQHHHHHEERPHLLVQQACSAVADSCFCRGLFLAVGSPILVPCGQSLPIDFVFGPTSYSNSLVLQSILCW